MINDVANFLPHFLGIFPSQAICIFPSLLGFPFITQPFAFNFNSSKIIYWLPIARPSHRAMLSHCSFRIARKTLQRDERKAFKFSGYIHEKTKTWCREDFIHKMRKKREEKKAASETRDAIYFYVVCCSPFRNDARKKKRKNAVPSFCEGSLNLYCQFIVKLIKTLLHFSTVEKFFKERTSQVFTVKFFYGSWGGE